MTLPDSHRDLVIVMSPCGAIEPSPRLAIAAQTAGGTGVLDLGPGNDRALHALALMRRSSSQPVSVRIPAGCAATSDDVRSAADGRIGLVVLAADSAWRARDVISHYRTLAEVTSLREARRAAEAGVHGLVLRGTESGGRVSELSAFILLQQVAADEAVSSPLWVAGGIGPRTAAACVVGGATGVVLDSQFALMGESDLPDDVRSLIRRMDGSESFLANGWRGMSLRPGRRPRKHSAGADGGGEVADAAARLPVGQDGCLAVDFARRWPSTSAAVQAIRRGILEATASDETPWLLAAGSRLARAWGTTLPVAQGPMTRVSDQVPFVAAVAAAGAMPFVALALSGPGQARRTLTEAAAAMAGRPWGVGVLGFAPDDVRAAHLALIREVAPGRVIIAGGSPRQARELEDVGIPAYLHVPSPGLLRQFLQAGSRRFVFEGMECGGHVGPRTSFSLWEAQMAVLEEFLAEQPDGTEADLEVLLAGGIHDARSAAVAATVAAPLARRGARVGVLMGTAYLFTREAIEHGAIQPTFQHYVLTAQRTALLTTGPGHTTRCVHSPFVDEFERQHAALESAGLDSRDMRERLELLNLGRLRIASKAQRRDGESQTLVTVDDAVQEAEGLFMAGQAAVLRTSTTTLRDLHDEVTHGSGVFSAARRAALRTALALDPPRAPARQPKPADIAIVGMSCVFPGSPDLASYWRTVIDGFDRVTEIPAERWSIDDFYAPQARQAIPDNSSASKWGGFLPQTPFDPIQYGIPPTALSSIDPQQLLALEIARRALLDAGYDPAANDLDHSRTGVVFGAQGGSDFSTGIWMRTAIRSYLGELPPEIGEQLPQITEDTFPGTLANVICGRIANRLNLGGPNFTVDAACASSLAALRAACTELAQETSDVMLCGGVDTHNGIHDYVMFSATHALSASGRCRVFDSDADGTTLGEGVACVVLKRLADAERAGDRIYAVIKGIGTSSDGRALGLTAPRPDGQRLAFARAYEMAGIAPSEVGLIEAHGTGTAAGDQTELESLTEVFTQGGAAPGSCTLGSVKSQIGHTKCCAGLAGLIKAALAIHTGVLPPTINLGRPSAAWDRDKSPFVFSKVSRPWVTPASKRVAGVSAFGFGGTNFHAVLAGYNAGMDPRHARDEWPAELFCFRGADRPAAYRRIESLVGELRSAAPPGSPQRLRALAAGLNGTDDQASSPVQVAVVARDVPELTTLLWRALASEHDPAAGLIQPPAAAWPEGPQVAFLFPGQGSQRTGALSELFVAFPELRDFLGEDARWSDLMFPPAAFDALAERGQQARLRDTAVAQPALGIGALAVTHLLRRLGVEPDMTGGHSYGELAALAAAGTFCSTALLEVSSERAAAILAAVDGDPGAMAAVSAGYGAVSDMLAEAGLAGDVVIANHNSPGQVVISGPSPAVDNALAVLRSNGQSARRLDVACAFHSPVVAAGRGKFHRALASHSVSPPRIPVWSNRTGAPYPSDPDLIRYELAEQIVSPVNFAGQIQSMYDHGARVFVEVGPGDVLSGLVRSILGDQPHLVVACEGHADGDGLRSFLTALAQLACSGVPVRPGWLFRGRDVAGQPPGRPENRQFWTVDGFAVRDEAGAYVPGGVSQARPVRLAVPRADAGHGDSEAEAMLGDFFRTSRELIAAQQAVMLSYFAGRSGTRSDYQAAPVTPAPSVTAPAAGAGRAPVDDRSRMTDAHGSPGSLLPAAAETHDMVGLLLEAIVQRTGYPEDLLDVDLDLEADLSIDSIKRTEIIGEVARRAGITTDGDPGLQDIFRARTIRAMAGNLSQLAGLPASVPPAAPRDGPVALAPAHEPDTGAPPPRLLAAPVAASCAPGSSLALAGGRFMVTGDSATTGPVAEYLRGLGAAAQEGTLKQAQDRPSEFDGLLCLDALTDASDPILPAAFPAIRSVLRANARWMLAAAVPGSLPAAGLSGLFGTIAVEHPEVTARLVNLAEPIPAGQLGQLLTAELASDSSETTVFYSQGRREMLTFRPCELPGKPGASLPDDGRPEAAALGLDSDSVVVMFGGARGITAWTARAFAAASQCRLELVGRTRLADEPEEDPRLAAAVTLTQLRSAIGSGGRRTAAEVDRIARQLLAGREVRGTIAELRGLGSQVSYHCVDAGNAAAVKRLIKEIYAAYNRIDGVVHGAGVIEDRLIVDKDPESFARVFNVKVGGGRAILAGLDGIAQAPKFTVFFGSEAAYGNRGQADYAAANAALESIGARWSAATGRRCLTFHWGAWAPVGPHQGMVTEELRGQLQQRGVQFINPAAGALAVLRELAWGDPALTSVLYSPSALLPRAAAPGGHTAAHRQEDSANA
jgi:acyl transferase domain-containing protein/NAD(P)H-dependent flavin oxidoreductase YrpB (nitropropane dioxygenase family)